MSRVSIKSKHDLPAELGPLWDKMSALTLEALEPVLSPWMGKGEIKAVIQRRDLMKAGFEKQMAADPDFVTR